MKDIKNLREANSFIDSCYDSTIEVKDICNFCKRQEAREDYIDILRGIGIVFMIMGHIGFGFIFDKYIHAFHMPMFFIISGFFYKKKENMKISQIVVNKVKKLIVPMIVHFRLNNFTVGYQNRYLCYF